MGKGWYLVGVVRSEPGSWEDEQYIEVTQRCYNYLKSKGFSGLCNSLSGRNLLIVESTCAIPTGRMVCLLGSRAPLSLKYDAHADTTLELELQNMPQTEIKCRAAAKIRNRPEPLMKVRDFRTALSLKVDFTLDDVKNFLDGDAETTNENMICALRDLIRMKYLDDVEKRL